MKPPALTIASSYIFILIIVVIIAFLYYKDEIALTMMDSETEYSNELNHVINHLNIEVASLALRGESAMGWTNIEKEKYHNHQSIIDSILLQLTKVFPNNKTDIDSLRIIFKHKEKILYELTDVYIQQKKFNDQIIDRIPTIQPTQSEKTTKKKRKKFLGIFGKKGKDQPEPPVKSYQLTNNFVRQNKLQKELLKSYADTLSRQNVIINEHLRDLINDIDMKNQKNVDIREKEISATRSKSYREMGILIAIVLGMLALSLIIIHWDIRKQIQYRRRLEESMRQNTLLLEMRKRIILTISHDIRGPLNVISGSAELAIDTRDKKKRDSYLNNARYLCRHVVHLLNNLLDVYRLNEAKETPNNVPFRLNALFDRIAVGAARIINDKGLIFRHDISDMDVTVIGDEDRIEQIVDNLLSNAVKFTSTGSVGISASYGNGHLVMAISDSGIGMTEETVKRIFRPFERADNVDHVEGFGLGLSITKGLISLLGGTVQVISDVGKGTTFHVSLPLALSDIEIEKESRPDRPSDKPGRLPRNVIVIDDDPMQRDIVREMLERNSVSCNTCATVTDVVKLMRENDYDMLLTDINMPGTDGFALLELLRKSDIGNSKEIPVVAMTARDDEENRHLLGYGFAGCLFKPFSMQDLLERISIIYAASQGHGNEMTDFSNLIGELDDKCLILDTLVKATKNDVAELKKAMRKDNRTALKNVLHRIAPTWELLDAGDGLINLRNNLKRKDITTEEISALVYPVINRMENIMTDAYNKMEELRYEKQNTDC